MHCLCPLYLVHRDHSVIRLSALLRNQTPVACMLCDSESGESYDRSSLCKYDHLLMYNQFSCPLCVVHIKIVCSEYENSHAVA